VYHLLLHQHENLHMSWYSSHPSNQTKVMLHFYIVFLLTCMLVSSFMPSILFFGTSSRIVVSHMPASSSWLLLSPFSLLSTTSLLPCHCCHDWKLLPIPLDDLCPLDVVSSQKKPLPKSWRNFLC